MPIEVGTTTHRFDPLSGQLGVEEAKPLRPFIPPVTEEFGIVQRADHARRSLGLIALQDPGHQSGEMAGVLLGSLLRPLGYIRRLNHKIAFIAHPPQVQSSRQMLFIKVEIPGVSGVATLKAPHLLGALGIAEKHGSFSSAPVGSDLVDVIGRGINSLWPPGTAGLPQIRQLGEVVIVRWQRTPSGNELTVGEKKLEPALRQTLLKAMAQSAVLLAIGPDRWDPVISWAIGAFRQPHPSGPTA